MNVNKENKTKLVDILNKENELDMMNTILLKVMKCPICGSDDLLTERRLNGDTLCLVCGFKGSYTKFIEQTDIINHISHEEAKVLLQKSDMLSLLNYINQQEKKEKQNSLINENTNRLMRLYKQLSVLRNDQLKNTPLNERGVTVGLDVVVCDKINKLLKEMGLPIDI